MAQAQTLDVPVVSNEEGIRVSAIHAGHGSLVSEVSLVDDLHKERRRDKLREKEVIVTWLMPSTLTPIR